MTNKMTWQGKFEMIIKNKETGEITYDEKFNRVMNTVLDQLVDSLKGTSPNLEIKYLALGTSNTPVTDTDTQLGAEIFRTLYTVREDVLS